jgi:glutathione S-transferase
MQTIDDRHIPSWETLKEQMQASPTVRQLQEQKALREAGDGLPHTDAKVRLFGTTEEPRVTFFRESAAWCPYCQKVWILLEEKRIPYKVEKINMRSYGDKPESFLKIVPNGLLPAIKLDGNLQTESLDIMLNLERTFAGPQHPSLWPSEDDPQLERAIRLMRLERDLFSRWCNFVFRPSMGNANRKRFEEGLDLVEEELKITPGPWFLQTLSIVDLTYVTHVERMCASIAYWCNLRIRDKNRWPALNRWLDAFEELPSYQATRSDYYTHVMDIPPQYGPAYPTPGHERLASMIDGEDGKSWHLSLPPLQEGVEVVSAAIVKTDEEARHEALYKLLSNYAAVTKFALRGAGIPGKKRFQVFIYEYSYSKTL